MKRGQALETIVKMVPTIIVILILAAILFGLWALIAKGKSDARHDFDRVIEEFKILIKEKVDKDTCEGNPFVFAVPIKEAAHQLYFYFQSPSVKESDWKSYESGFVYEKLPKCAGKACICFKEYWTLKNEFDCTAFDDIVDCDEDTKKLCFEQPYTYVKMAGHSPDVLLVRECNRLRFQ